MLHDITIFCVIVDYLYQYKEFKCKMCGVWCNGVKVLVEHF